MVIGVLYLSSLECQGIIKRSMNFMVIKKDFLYLLCNDIIERNAFYEWFATER